MLQWAYKTGADNAGHTWNSSFVITDSDFFLEELLEKPDTLGVAAASNVLYDQLVADASDVIVRRGLRGRGITPGSVSKRRRLRRGVGGGSSGGLGTPEESWSSSERPENGAASEKSGVGQGAETSRTGLSNSQRRGSKDSGETDRARLSPSDSAHSKSLAGLSRALSVLGRGVINRIQSFKKPLSFKSALEPATMHDTIDSGRLRSSPASRRKLSQVNTSSNEAPVKASISPLPKAGANEELETGELIGRPESGQDWSAAEARRHAEDRALANALILSRLSDYAIVSSRSNVGRLAAQVISARKRVTQTGPLGPVVHSTTGGGLVNPLGASAGPGLPGGTLRWSNTVEKLVYEELDRRQFPEDCEKAQWLVTRLHNQGGLVNFLDFRGSQWCDFEGLAPTGAQNRSRSCSVQCCHSQRSKWANAWIILV